MTDGTERLCRLLYGRDEQPSDYLGGSNAKMLHDAADRIIRARERLAALQGALCSMRDDYYHAGFPESDRVQGLIDHTMAIQSALTEG